MVGQMALRPLLHVLRRAQKNKTWSDLILLLKERLFATKVRRQKGPLPPVLFQMATGYWLSQAIYVAAKLGIADLLEKHPQSSAELAAATRCDPHSLFRVLRALASAGILSQVNKDGFALTRLGNALRSNVPGSLRSIVITLGEIHYRACGELIHTVRTGSPAFNRVFGASLFEHLQHNAQDGAAFNQGMTDLAYLLARAVLLAYDFSGITTIVDLGGGEGELLRSIIEFYPRTRGTVFDLPNDHCPPRCTAENAERFSYVSGNFFDSVPERADVYLLCGVLHDWSDELAALILQNCRKAMARVGRLLIVETIVPESNSASFSKFLDINMLVMTTGRERTKSEFHSLLRGSGFIINRVIPTMAPQSIIEAYPQEADRKAKAGSMI
jgi:O-methyltransferase domain/Dimerisation domain